MGLHGPKTPFIQENEIAFLLDSYALGVQELADHLFLLLVREPTMETTFVASSYHM